MTLEINHVENNTHRVPMPGRRRTSVIKIEGVDVTIPACLKLAEGFDASNTHCLGRWDCGRRFGQCSYAVNVDLRPRNGNGQK